jgi:hypothetical protein
MVYFSAREKYAKNAIYSYKQVYWELQLKSNSNLKGLVLPV